MIQNEKLALAIGEVGWSKFKSMLEYKAGWYGKNIIYIGRFEPSSKMCSHCGAINKDLRLKERSWTCKSCGTDHDRDLNAAINIKNIGLGNRPSTVNVSQDERPCVWVEKKPTHRFCVNGSFTHNSRLSEIQRLKFIDYTPGLNYYLYTAGEFRLFSFS